jgi:hypothetical protein
LSASFHEKFDQKNADKNSRSYKEALLYLLLSQTSCFRYWGHGVWTDYAKELCRRGMEAVNGKTFVPFQGIAKLASVFQKKPKATAKVAQANTLSKPVEIPPELPSSSDKGLLGIPEVINEIERHKWFESEKAGHDVGIEWAREDWLKKYAKDWRRNH